ncbi:MAG: hypothetical protein JNL28_02870 [Planctomycetes bacterium]|nr:hypothetical protein [Planctomycetota bacterium]
MRTAFDKFDLAEEQKVVFASRYQAWYSRTKPADSGSPSDADLELIGRSPATGKPSVPPAANATLIRNRLPPTHNSPPPNGNGPVSAAFPWNSSVALHSRSHADPQLAVRFGVDDVPGFALSFAELPARAGRRMHLRAGRFGGVEELHNERKPCLMRELRVPHPLARVIAHELGQRRALERSVGDELHVVRAIDELPRLAHRATAGRYDHFMDLHRLAEERSLELHRAIAAILQREPERVVEARARLQDWMSRGRIASSYADEWSRLLAGPLSELCRVLVDEGEGARALRQCTPFAGFIDPRTRWKIWRDVRSRLSDAS